MVTSRKETTKERLPFWKRLKISELGLRIVLGGVIVTGGLAYLFLTSTTATNGLQVKDLTDELDSLVSRQAELQADVDRLQSFQRLDAATKQMDLVSVTSVDVVTGASGAVAAR